jgi:hypothetical protein
MVIVHFHFPHDTRDFRTEWSEIATDMSIVGYLSVRAPSYPFRFCVMVTVTATASAMTIKGAHTFATRASARI